MIFDIDDGHYLVLTVAPEELVLCRNCPNVHIVMGKSEATNRSLIEGLTQLVEEAEQGEAGRIYRAPTPDDQEFEF